MADAGRWARTRAAVGAAIATALGLAPHVLHHMGLIAGTALIAGTTGTVVLGAVGLLLSVPFLLRLRRRHGSWRAPLAALAVFALAYLASSLLLGPALGGH